MPEVVRMMKEGLDRSQADAKTREMAWISAYWSMGLVCDLDEAHRALGDVLPFILGAEHYLNCKGQAFLEAYSSAQQEGRLQAGATWSCGRPRAGSARMSTPPVPSNPSRSRTISRPSHNAS